MPLHITNGDSTARLIERAGIGGAILPWRDFLHNGPVPADLDAAELAAERAAYLASCGYGDQSAIRDEFCQRDRTLAEAPHDAEIVLWFEHDLYDQLQLVQILDRIRPLDLDRLSISLIAIDRFLGVEPFHGLGQLGAGQLASQATEPAPFLGDSTFWQRLSALSDGPRPLLLRADSSPFTASAGGTTNAVGLVLTEDGRNVLAGRADAIALRGIDRWFGGVRLAGNSAAWRWNGQTVVPWN